MKLMDKSTVFRAHRRASTLSVSLLVLLLSACTSRPTAAEGSKAQAGSPTAENAPSAPRDAPDAGGAAAAGPTHAVYDLAHNRLAAHLIHQGGMLIPAGYGGAAKYFNFRRPWACWKTAVTLEGKTVALATKPKTWLVFPLSRRQESADTITVRLFAPKKGRLRLKLNGRKIERQRLAKGWQTVSVALKKGMSRRGENRLDLSFPGMSRIEGKKAAAAVQWVHLGSAAADETLLDAPAKDGKLFLPAGGGLAYYLYPYKGTDLTLSFSGSCKVRVQAWVGADEKQVVDKTVSSGVVDLEPAAGQVTRLELSPASGCGDVTLERAALTRTGKAPKVKRGKPPKYVLFWLIDNARADRFSLYNPKTRVKTPVITALGKDGTVFSRAYIQGTESRVSHASIWTGLYPRQARFVDPKSKLKTGWVTLAEAIRKGSKLKTAAWVANGFVSKFWGFAAGFQTFRNTLHKGGGLTAERLAGHAITYIEKNASNPFYLYIGTIDPHVSWRGRQPWLKQYHPEPYRGTFKKNVMGPIWDKIAGGGRKVSKADKKRILAIYDSTVSYNDHHLGRVLEALKKKGIRDETMVVITADHGEEFWEHGRAGHGQACRQKLVAVPLIIHYPPLFGRGVRVTEGVDVLSVMPSILDALGAPIPQRVQSESLLPLAQGVSRGYPRPSMATQYELAHTMRLEQWKIRVGGRGKPRLFDMESAEGEHKNVVADRPLATRWLTDAHSTFLIYQSLWRSGRWGVPSNHKAALPADFESGKLPKTIRP